MPIISIQAASPDNPTFLPRMLTDIREASAQALKCPTHNIWVIFDPISPAQSSPGDDLHVLPPLVTIRANVGRTPDERQSLASAVAKEVGRGLSVPSHRVWIHYQEMRPQDIWFNDRWTG